MKTLLNYYNLVGITILSISSVHAFEAADLSQEKLISPNNLTQFVLAAGDHKASDKERKILYWVAPMDANYRRDKPGKSPMGMDLIPVYEDHANMKKNMKH